MFKQYHRIRGLLDGVGNNPRDGDQVFEGDRNSNLVVYQAKESFSLKEPSLAPYRTLAQRMEEKFSTFKIEHSQRSENWYTNTLGSQICLQRE